MNQIKTTMPAVVYVVGFRAPPPQKPAAMYQRNKQFLPKILAITRGQTVSFANTDRVPHNVFSNSRSRVFDLGVTDPPDYQQVVFETLGIVPVHCHLHADMQSYILVLPNRAFAIVQNGGTFSLTGIPPGKHVLYAWHPLATSVKQNITVNAMRPFAQNLTLVIERSPARHGNKYGRPYHQRNRY